MELVYSHPSYANALGSIGISKHRAYKPGLSFKKTLIWTVSPGLTTLLSVLIVRLGEAAWTTTDNAVNIKIIVQRVESSFFILFFLSSFQRVLIFIEDISINSQYIGISAFIITIDICNYHLAR